MVTRFVPLLRTYVKLPVAPESEETMTMRLPSGVVASSPTVNGMVPVMYAAVYCALLLFRSFAFAKKTGAIPPSCVTSAVSYVRRYGRTCHVTFPLSIN